jgi:hypothetical protein
LTPLERDDDRLATLVRGSEWFMRALRAAREVALPEWLIGAGAVRTLVWDHLHGRATRMNELADLDCAFFDKSDLSREGDALAEARLRAAWPDAPWEATNQAAVHLWYEAQFGIAVPRLLSTREAVATWPETVTSVALHLDAHDRISVLAPFGTADLFGLVLRRNPNRVTRAQFIARAASKRVTERWPRVVIVDD